MLALLRAHSVRLRRRDGRRGGSFLEVMYIWAAAGFVRLASAVRREHAEFRRGRAGNNFGDCGIAVLAEALK
eukprot:563151-Pleurochrysis_carterae.AAC.2